MENKSVIIDYTNHRGERAMRKITPNGMVQFKKTAYHPVMQWILTAWDHSKGTWRDFAMDRIHSWVPVTHVDSLPAEGSKINDSPREDIVMRAARRLALQQKG